MIRKILIPLALAGFLFYLFFQFFATRLVAHTLTQSLGTPVKVRQVHLKLFPAEVGIYGIKVMNYKGFEEPVMVSIPEVFVRADLGGLFKKRIRIRKVVFDLKKVTVEKNREGEINLKVLMDYSEKRAPAPGPSPAQPPPQPSPPSGKPGPRAKQPPVFKLQIDEAQMSLGKVSFVDYGTGRRVEKNFDFAIDKMLLENVTDMESLTTQVALLILQKIGRLALGEQVGRIAGEFFDDARNKLARMFPAK